MSDTKRFHKALNAGSPKWNRKNKNKPVMTSVENRIQLAKRLCPMGKANCVFPAMNACSVVEQAVYFQKRSYALPISN